MTTTIHVVGHLGGRNFGDDLMLRGLRALAEARFGAVDLVTWQATQLRAFTRATAGGPSRLVLLPGSTFHDYYRGGRAARQDAAKAAYVAFARVARARGWPVVLCGSLGPSWRRRSLVLDRAVARAAHRLLLRDERSLRYARGLGGGEASLAPDVAVPALADLAATLGATPSEAGVALVCPAVDRQYPAWSYPLPDTAAEGLRAGGCRVLRVLAAHGSAATDRDEEATDRLAAAAARHGLAFDRVAPPAGASWEVPAFAGQLARAQVVVSARLHPAMAALSLGVPTLVAPYHPKLREVLAPAFEGVVHLPPEATGAEVAAAVASAAPPVVRTGAPRWDDHLVEGLVG